MKAAWPEVDLPKSQNIRSIYKNQLYFCMMTKKQLANETRTIPESPV